MESLGARIATWLKIVRRGGEDIEICIDYQTDWDLFVGAQGDRVPPWCTLRHVWHNINELLLTDFYKKNRVPEHHALYDAQANRYAFRERPPAAL